MRETAKDKYEISKIESARRLVHAASRMIYESEDALAVDLLVQSANQVLTDLMAKRDIQDPILDSCIVRSDQKENLRKLFKLYSNFVKHADKSPDCVIDVFDISTSSEIGLYFAILRYRQLEADITAHMKLYLGYYLMRNPSHGIIDVNLSENLKELAGADTDIVKFRNIWASCALQNSDYSMEKGADCADWSRGKF